MQQLYSKTLLVSLLSLALENMLIHSVAMSGYHRGLSYRVATVNLTAVFKFASSTEGIMTWQC
jgi:hypothetical protein